MLQKYEKPRENGNLLPVFREHFKTTSKIVKDKSNRVGLHAKIAESLPVFCKDSTTSRRSQIFLSVAALEYLGKVRDTDKSGGAKRIYSRFVEAKNRKRNEGTNDSSMIGAVLPGCGSVKIQRASVEDALCIKRNRILGCFPNPVRRMILSGLAIRKHSFRLMHCIYFFSAKKSFTWSLAMMPSLKMYAPVLSDFTILIHLVNCLPVPVFSVATTFFAI